MKSARQNKKPNKPVALRHLLHEGAEILSCLGVPISELTPRAAEKMIMAFLAVADVKKRGQWHVARLRTGKDTLKSRDVISYMNEHFCENISMGSYDDIRRKDLKLPVVAGIIVASANKPTAATNDPTRGFSLAPDYLGVIRSFGTSSWGKTLADFMSNKPSLDKTLKGIREIPKIPIRLPSGIVLDFSLGEHNQLQKAIIEEFLPRYGFGAEVLYVGDTAKKQLFKNEDLLSKLNFFALEHDELPDVVSYSSQKNWIYLIEAVHSSGPISPIRLLELQKLTSKCQAAIIYVTAFLDRDTFRKFAPDIAWESEVWIANAPDHMIHFNGDKFLGPYTLR
jgi:type II restriction enzyme